MDVIEKLFSDLESNNLQRAEESKKRLCEHFSHTKESWLVSGLMDYFGQTNSSRIVDVLVKVQQPHDKHIFDRLCEWLHTPHRNQAITLFGHIVRKHPSWLYKVASHPLLRDILKLLRSDTNIITAMNALFCLIILLPIIPTAMPQYLADLFDIFLYLGAWNCHQQPRLTEEQAIHLQIGLSTYFQRLYGMYPCNFVAYLRDHVMKEQPAVFAHTIRPLLETVKMHPALLTSTRDLEKAIGRWKEMEPHDVVVECSRFALDYQTRSAAAVGGLRAAGAGAVGFGDLLGAGGVAGAISECPYYKMMSGRAIVETPISQQLRRLLKSTPSQASSLCSPFYSPFSEPNDTATEPQRIDNIWSPLWSVMATPPPTMGSGAPPTPTPSMVGTGSNYTMRPIGGVGPASVAANIVGAPTQQQQLQHMHQNQQLCVSGSSPPEAAVEATPETTPMKEVLGSAARPFPINSPAVRAIWGTSQQPTSPLRREAVAGAAFRFNANDSPQSTANAAASATATTAVNYDVPISSPKILSFVNERNMYATQMRNDGTTTTSSSNNNMMDGGAFAATATPPPLQGDSTPEDAEVTQINRMGRPPLPPQSRYKRSPNGNTKRTTSGVQTDVGGGGGQTADGGGAAVEGDADDDIDEDDCEEGDDDGEDVGAGDDGNDDDCENNGNSPQAKVSARRLQSKRSHFARKIDRITIGTQTIQQLPQSYEQMFFDLLAGNADAAATGTEDAAATPAASAVVAPETPEAMAALPVPLSPHALLDQYIETAIRKRPTAVTVADQLPSSNAARTAAAVTAANAASSEQIQLLNLQLQYERYRREVHAERNRRLLGKSRVNASLEMDNEKLREQRDKLAAETDELTGALNKARMLRTAHENEHAAEVQRLQREVHTERTQVADLRAGVETLQRSVAEERRQRQEAVAALAACKAEMFDMRNELSQTQERAEWGVRCRDELHRLQQEVMLMGEIQVKCRERLTELNGLQTRDAEAAMVRLAFAEEVKEMRYTLDTKSAQLDTARARLAELEAQLARRDSMFTDQKRLLKTVKEEYQDRFRALEAKYTAQKAVILRLEEEMLDLYHRNQSASNGAAGGGGSTAAGATGGSSSGTASAQQTPDADRQSVVGSLDHASPLSMSLASSEGLAISLRSTATEIRNLHPLVAATNFQQQPTTAASSIIVEHPLKSSIGDATTSAVAGVDASSASTNRQPVSEDIPVPSTSNMPRGGGVSGAGTHLHHQLHKKHHHL